MYEYKADIVRVIDGDTVELDIDLGCHITLRKTCRLYGINAPELRGETQLEGAAAKQFVSMRVGPEMPIRTHLDRGDKYGRLLVEIFPQGFNAPSINELMVRYNHATTVKY